MKRVEKQIDYGCSKDFRPNVAFGHCWGGFWEPAAGVDPNAPRQCYNCACYHEPIVEIIEVPELSELYCNFHCIGPDGVKCKKYDTCDYAPPF